MRAEDAESAARMMPWSNAVPSVRTPEPVADERVEQESIGDALGLLISRSGPDLGSEYAVGGSPVSIGSGARCGVRVNDPDLGAEEARIWIRKGQLMVHRITKLTNIVNDGAAGGWLILDPNDTFEIGQHRFEFRLMPEGYTIPTPPETPNVLRDGSARPAANPDAAPLPRQVTPPRPSTFSELMPRNDLGTNSD
jgi:hypothetical protein